MANGRREEGGDVVVNQATETQREGKDGTRNR